LQMNNEADPAVAGVAQELPAGLVHYHDTGSGPPLVMLHGGGPGASGQSNFGGNVPGLAKRFRLLIVDQPGYGGTPMPLRLSEHYLSYTARLIDELLAFLKVERAHVLGNSLGTSTAVRFALDFPGRVDRIVLMGPAGNISPGMLAPRPTTGFQMVQNYYLPPGPSRERMVAFLREMVYDQSILTDELIDSRYAATLDSATSDGAARMLEHYRRPEFAGQAQMWQEIQAIENPTLITWGLNDRDNPWDGALFALQAMKDVQLHVWSKCGHWAQVERRAEFEQLVTNFLLDTK
jgi:4,5:9,10-diseco-3-hydroxy-5,9,17-trioxoandrosta-1(10),2-diene-4-oate hydrolase